MSDFFTEISGTTARGTHIFLTKGGKATHEFAINLAKRAGIRSDILLKYCSKVDPSYSYQVTLENKLLRPR